MKSITSTLLAPALAIALPCLAFAQAGASPSGQPTNKSATAGMQHISQDQLEDNLTAKILIGTDVHGIDDKKIGSVVDVVLAPAPGLSAHGESRQPVAVSPLYPEVVVPGGVTGPETPRANDEVASRTQYTVERTEPAVIVSTGGVLGIGSDLVRVPLTRIAYDADKKQVRLNITESEWKTLQGNRSTGQ